MKKCILLFLVLLNIGFSYAHWATNPDDDVTLIDCVNGNDTTGIPFDSNQPYQTLQAGIEKSISYINGRINFIGNEETASGKIFQIKVNCTVNNLLDNNISLNFNGVWFNNTLLIEWIGENGLIIQNLRFNLKPSTWNIIFKNAQFLNTKTPYFYDFYDAGMFRITRPSSNGIKIIDSYIKLLGTQLWESKGYTLYSYTRNGQRHYNSYGNYTNEQYIENSIIDIELNSDYNFKLPGIIKNSQINFINGSGALQHNIIFSEDGDPLSQSWLDSAHLISNEINLWWNNLSTKNTSNIAYINNSFTNFNEINFAWWVIYLNNYFDNNFISDLSSTPHSYNNVFKNNFIDTNDTYNLRKNYGLDNIGAQWISWTFKKDNNLDLFHIDMTSWWLYEEITWQPVPIFKDSVYIIYDN